MAREGMRGRNQTNDRGESKLSVAQAGLPPGLTVGALLAAAALAVVAQLVCHRFVAVWAHTPHNRYALAGQRAPSSSVRVRTLH